MPRKRLVGTHLTMSLVDDRTRELWSAFMPRRKEIARTVSLNLFSLQVYSAGHFDHFDPAANFEKWALVEVDAETEAPPGMEEFILERGLYAVFVHKGSPADSRTFQRIFSEWLPRSAYMLAHRPHFEVLGAKSEMGSPIRRRKSGFL